MEKAVLDVKGMSCAHCERAVVDGLKEIGVSEVSASAKTGVVELCYDPAKSNLDAIKAEILDMGYEVAGIS